MLALFFFFPCLLLSPPPPHPCFLYLQTSPVNQSTPPSPPSLLPCPRPPPPSTGLPPLLSPPHFTCLSNTINSCETFLMLRSRLQWLFLCHARTCTLFLAACAPAHARTEALAHGHASHLCFLQQHSFFFFFLLPPRADPLSSHAAILPLCVRAHTHAHKTCPGARTELNETTGLLISLMNVRQFTSPTLPIPSLSIKLRKPTPFFTDCLTVIS